MPNGRSLLLVGVAALMLVACGAGDKSAQEMMPNLSDQGFALIEEGKPIAPEEIDIWRALYLSEDNETVVVEIYVEQNSEVAEEQYLIRSQALENLPPDFLGIDATQQEIDGLSIGDESRAFVTAEADQAGNRVWTDIYRDGKVIAITHLLTSDEDASDQRREIAEEVLN